MQVVYIATIVVLKVKVPLYYFKLVKIANRYFENVEQLKYLGMTATNENLIQEEIKRRLNSGNACYHSVQNLLSSRLLSKNVKIKIYKTIFACGSIWVLNLVSDIKGGA
jgi:hypothetical protein